MLTRLTCTVAFCFGVAMLALPASAEEVGEYDEPAVVPLSPAQLVRLRALVAEDAEARAIAAAEAELAAAALDDEPTPLAVIHYEGLVHTDPRRIATVAKLRQTADAAHLFRHWQLSGDDRAAAQLRRLIDAWFSTYAITGNDVNENKLLPLLLAYAALRDRFDDDRRADLDAFVQSLGETHARVVRNHDGRMTNRFTKHLRILAACGSAIGRDEWNGLALDGVRSFVAQSLRSDGTSADLEQRDSLTYQGSALKPPLELAMLAGDAGRELYAWESPQGGSLKKSIDYVVPYARGERVHREWVDTKIDLDRQRAAAGLAEYQPGRLFEPASALGALEAASFFDPSLLPLVRQLSGSDAERFPARRTLMTGRTPEGHGVPGFKNAPLPFPTLPALLRDAGYQTALCGKLHLWPHRCRYGFEEVHWSDGPGASPEEADSDYLRHLRSLGIGGDQAPHGVAGESSHARPWHIDERHHVANWTADRAVDFLGRRDPTRPFFLNVSFFQPPTRPARRRRVNLSVTCGSRRNCPIRSRPPSTPTGRAAGRLRNSGASGTPRAGTCRRSNCCNCGRRTGRRSTTSTIKSSAWSRRSTAASAWRTRRSSSRATTAKCSATTSGCASASRGSRRPACRCSCGRRTHGALPAGRCARSWRGCRT